MSSVTIRTALRERLTAAPVVNSRGQMVEPGEAAPFPAAHRVPTMLSERELNYLYWLGSTMPEQSQVVELGSFLGGSTAALVEGLRAGGRRHHPVLVYDSFIAPKRDEDINSWWMKPFGLSAGEDFRPKYEKLHKSRLDRISIRQGWIPENADATSQRELYPEQRPIDLLFVDAAKTWGVHRTILSAFARHLKKGGVIVQQDFLDVQTSWLPVHMWQLRSVFRPLDLVRESPSMAFECVGDPAEVVDGAWDIERFRDRDTREDLWQQIIAYWAELIGPAAGFLHGHAARHSVLVGDLDGFVGPARRYEAWLQSRDSVGVYATATWSEMVRSTASVAGNARPAILQLAQECEARRSLCGYHDLTNPTFRSPNVRVAYWKNAMERMRAEGHRRVALYGAGAHTDWLLANCWDHNAIRIECILDDAPVRSELRGIPVRRADRDAVPEGLPVIPSSDAHEKTIIERAASVFVGRNPIVPVYTSAHEVVAVPLASESSQPKFIRHHAHQIEERAGHRIDLGLTEQRSWMTDFVKRLAVPSWVQGFVNYRDGQFLWDLVEATRPDVVAEIGTASGVSTALLASACEFFGGTTKPCGRVHTFDIADRCYFDQTRAVGTVALETFPHLRDAIEINPRCTATDAARRFSVGEVDLAFIDGDHRHPTPTLDLLALLYAMKPGAWVVLHDIELTEVHRATSSVAKPDWELATGAETLFHRWPFQKTQPRYPLADMNNIGAIKLPMNPGDAVGFLLEHLREAWEINDAPNLTVLRAALRAA